MEIMNACLHGVVVFGSAAARAIGTVALSFVSPLWMPLAVAVPFALLHVAMVTLLDATPAPSARDMRLRSRRQPMSSSAKVKFVKYGEPPREGTERRSGTISGHDRKACRPADPMDAGLMRQGW